MTRLTESSTLNSSDGGSAARVGVAARGATFAVMRTRGIWEAALLGTVAGMRAFTPLAALGLRFWRPRVAVPIVIGAVGELVNDKRPQTGDRTAPAMLLPRVAVGATAGGLVAHLLGSSPALGAVTGGAAAIVSTFVFHRLRVEAAARVPPIAAGIGEDLIAVGLSAATVQSLQ